ncbi:MAG: hypothetical protein J1E61_08770 [Lachnospiraceae bacterium]|nr:hypothetical protein [Lachnospiraceae bacterium]
MKKKAVSLLLAITMTALMLTGCATEETTGEIMENQVEEAEEPEVVSEETKEAAEDTQEMTREKLYGIKKDSIEEAITPILSERRLKDVVWDEDLLPYVEYDWLADENLWQYNTPYTSVQFGLTDIDQDGQRELLATVSNYKEDIASLTYTVKDDEVVICEETADEWEITSPYAIPGYAGLLYEEDKDAIRHNILAGLAKATGLSHIDLSWRDDRVTSSEAYFFPRGTDKEDYNMAHLFLGNDLPVKVQLDIHLIKNYGNGKLYEIKFDEAFDISERYDFRARQGWDRFHLGFFYVQGDTIYRVRDIDAEGITGWSEEEIISKGQLVCQSESMEDKLDPEEKGFHERISVQGNICYYRSWENYVETGFYERFVWERGRGLIEYVSGYGAGAEHMELKITENTLNDADLIKKQNAAYQEFLEGQSETADSHESCVDLLGGQNLGRFLYRDVDGDGLEELHLWDEYWRYYILKYEDGGINIVYSNVNKNVTPFHEGGKSGLLFFDYVYKRNYNKGKDLKLGLFSFAEINEEGEFAWSPLYICWYDTGINTRLKARTTAETDGIGYNEVIVLDEQEWEELENEYMIGYTAYPTYHYLGEWW